MNAKKGKELAQKKEPGGESEKGGEAKMKMEMKGISPLLLRR